jgi:hypothetical protein
MNSRVLPAASAALALALAAVPGRAALIAVYTPPGEPLALEEMAAFARAVRENPEAPPQTRFTYRFSREPVLTGAFSVPAEVSAYVWADESVAMHPGYRMEGAKAYHIVELKTSVAAPVPEASGAARAWSTGFQSATVRNGRLGVSYTLARSAPVTLEAFSPEGRRLNRWKWREDGAGHFERSLLLPRASSGMLLLRWTSGEIRTIHKVRVPVSGP